MRCRQVRSVSALHMLMISPNSLSPLKVVVWPMFKHPTVRQAFRGALVLAISFAGLAIASAADTNTGTVLRLAPRTPTSAGETHAALALTSEKISGAYHITGRAKVVAQ